MSDASSRLRARLAHLTAAPVPAHNQSLPYADAGSRSEHASPPRSSTAAYSHGYITPTSSAHAESVARLNTTFVPATYGTLHNSSRGLQSAPPNAYAPSPAATATAAAMWSTPAAAPSRAAAAAAPPSENNSLSALTRTALLKGSSGSSSKKRRESPLRTVARQPHAAALPAEQSRQWAPGAFSFSSSDAAMSSPPPVEFMSPELSQALQRQSDGQSFLMKLASDLASEAALTSAPAAPSTQVASGSASAYASASASAMQGFLSPALYGKLQHILSTRWLGDAHALQRSEELLLDRKYYHSWRDPKALTASMGQDGGGSTNHRDAWAHWVEFLNSALNCLCSSSLAR